MFRNYTVISHSSGRREEKAAQVENFSAVQRVQLERLFSSTGLIKTLRSLRLCGVAIMDSEKVVAKRANIPEAGSEKKSNQIFIRNLSYDVTSDDLLQLFEVHGPVKNVSVVLENNVSRGFGFVKL